MGGQQHGSLHAGHPVMRTVVYGAIMFVLFAMCVYVTGGWVTP